MFLITLREKGCGAIDAPIDRQAGIVPANSALMGGRVIRRDFVEHLGVRLECDKAMREPDWHEDLLPIIRAEHDLNVPAESRRRPADINGHIEDRAPDHSNKL